MSEGPRSFLFGTRNKGECNSELKTGPGTDNPVKMSADDSFGFYFKAKKFSFKGMANLVVKQVFNDETRTITVKGSFGNSISSKGLFSMKEAYDTVCPNSGNFYFGLVGSSVQTVSGKSGTTTVSGDLFADLGLGFRNYIEKKNGDNVEIWPSWSLGLSFGVYENGSATTRREDPEMIQTAIKVTIIPIKDGDKYTTPLYAKLQKQFNQTLEGSGGEITVKCEDEFTPE